MAVALIQGASRGLGFQFAKVLASRPNIAQVIATSRSAEKSDALMDLQKQYPDKVHLLGLDVTSEEKIKTSVPIVTRITSGKLDLVINCSAILHPSGRGETSLRDVSLEGLRNTFEVNSIGPLLIAKYFSPLLMKGNGSFGSQNAKSHAGILVNMTARVSSMAENKLGGWYSYRLSKAALNMATKNLSIELGRGKSKVICVALHPGTLDTDLSRPYHKGVAPGKLFSTEQSAGYLMKIIDELSMEHTGKVIAWDGSEIPF